MGVALGLSWLISTTTKINKVVRMQFLASLEMMYFCVVCHYQKGHTFEERITVTEDAKSTDRFIY